MDKQRNFLIPSKLFYYNYKVNLHIIRFSFFKILSDFSNIKNSSIKFYSGKADRFLDAEPEEVLTFYEKYCLFRKTGTSMKRIFTISKFNKSDPL